MVTATWCSRGMPLSPEEMQARDELRAAQADYAQYLAAETRCRSLVNRRVSRRALVEATARVQSPSPSGKRLRRLGLRPQ